MEKIRIRSSEREIRGRLDFRYLLSQKIQKIRIYLPKLRKYVRTPYGGSGKRYEVGRYFIDDVMDVTT